MTQHYSDPSRANDAHALPDVEVFYVNAGAHQTCPPCQSAVVTHRNHISNHVGWWWETGEKSGYGRKGENSHGPFATEKEAVADAQSNSDDDSDDETRCQSCGIPIPMPRNDEPEALLCDTCAEPFEPEEGDITTEDHMTFYQYGRKYLEVAEGDDWQQAVIIAMQREQFWPNVWFISDHGNAHLLTLSGKAGRHEGATDGAE